MTRAAKQFLCLLVVSLSGGVVFGQLNLNTIGGFEQDIPSYWTKGNEPAGSTLSWASDQSRSLGHSLKITKTATADTAAWISENMCDIWSPQHTKNVDILVGAYVKTENVNINPTTNDERWYVSYTFYDSAGVRMGETKLPINQTVATSTGFVADTNAVGQSILPRDAWKTIVKFVGGKNATGTVWGDDFVFYGRGTWGGQDWNTGVGVPTGWYYWLPPNGGNDGLLDAGFENTKVTTEAAHTGLRSLKFSFPAGRRSQDGFVGTKRFLFNNIGSGIVEGDVLRISVWLKASGLVPDSAALYPGTWSVGFTPLWFTRNDNNGGYNPVGPSVDYTFAFPAVTQFDWTQYTLDVTVPTGVNAQALENRLHVYSRFVGTIYWDDLTVQKLDIAPLNTIGGFEQDMPSYWTKGNEPAGSTLSWASDQSRSLGHSLKITKTATADTAAWISENMCDIWSPQHTKNVDILVGAYIKTQGVNINPTTNDQRWYVSYTFYDSAGVRMGETKLPINQTVATSAGFVADTNAVGQTILPRDAWRTIVKFVGGKDATGTVWGDDFVFYGRGTWGGQDWNTGVGVPTGWYYWLPPNGGNDGLLDAGFENTKVTTEAAHTGLRSLKFSFPAGRRSQDGFVGTKRFLFSGASRPGVGSNDISELQGVIEGDVLRISVWLKASGLVPDSAALYPGTWSVGFTPLWFTRNDNNGGYNPVGPSVDYTFAFPAVTQFDWTQYTLDVTVPTGVNAQALENRLHVYSRFVGTIYWDDLTVQKLDIAPLNTIGGFEQDMPSYWTKGNEPAGSTLSWASDQSRSLGHSLKITKTATADTAAWISENMCDIWSPQHTKNVDILVGAYIKTQGVNINPTTNDQRWYVSYTFYDSAGVRMGETKLPINQTVATSAGFVADTNAVGQTILPRDAWRTIVKFVGGKDATGTVWGDDFVFYGRGTWGGQDWNTGVGVPTGWYYWLPPNGGNDGLLDAGFENTKVTTEAAHTGLRSLKFSFPAGRRSQDGFVGTKRFLFSGASRPGVGSNDISELQGVIEGDVLRISVWLKASGLVPDSAALYPGTWSVGFTPLWFTRNDNNGGYNPVGPSVDYTFAFPAVTQFDWTQYTLDVTVPTGVNAQALENRLHVYSRFVGTIYWDDLTVQVIGTTTGVNNGNGLPKVFELANNYPNPFNPTTTIQFGLPQDGQVSLDIFNVLGQKIKSLLNDHRQAGRYDIVWDGRDDNGVQVGTGIYFYRLQTGNVGLVKKMIMLK